MLHFGPDINKQLLKGIGFCQGIDILQHQHLATLFHVE